MSVTIEKKPPAFDHLKTALTHLKNKDKIVLSAFDFYRKKFPEYNIMGIYTRLSRETGFSIMTIRRIISNAKAAKNKRLQDKQLIVQNEHA